ncbi:MAG: leucine-rich repeat protein, partial [Oscillospiraceae bacterium]|nr:leucine-rich repeat protein [Oscillospiraceae bacterium]
MKSTKRIFSLLLALLMMVSLLPTPALAEAAPAFTLQPESGSHAPGERYLLTWELNRTPDRLELTREENPRVAEGVDPYEEDEAILVPLQELDPAADELELSAPAEETVFRLRAWYGEEALVSEGFTVSIDPAGADALGGQPADGEEGLSRTPAPAEEPEEPVILSEAKDPDGDSSSAEPPQNDAAELDVPDGAGDEPAAEPRPDEPQDAYAFVTQPQSGSFDPDTQNYMVSWRTSFTPVQVLVQLQASSDHWQTYSTLTMGLQQSLSTTISNAGWSQARVFRILAYYGSGEEEYVPSVEFTVSPANAYRFTTQPQDGTVAPGGSLTFTWETNFNPVKVEIVRDDLTTYFGGESHDYIVLASLAGSKTSHTLSYDELSILGSEDTILVRAYYGSGEQDYAESRAVKVTVVARAFTVQPTGGTVAPRGSLTFTWATNFNPVKVEIVRDDVTHYFGGVDHEYTVLATLAGSKTSHTMSYDELSILGSEDTILVRAYYDSDSFVRSDPADITLVSRAFIVQPIGGHVEPGGTLTFTWETNFDRVKVEIVRDDVTHYLGGVDHEYIVLATLAGSKTSHTMSYDELYALDSEDMILVRAYYDSDSFVRSSQIDVTLTSRAFTLQPTGGEVPVGASLTTTWATNFAPAKVEIVRESVWFDLVNEYHDYTVLATVDGAETSYPLPFVLLDSLGPLESIHVRAYYGTAENRYIKSDPISFTLGAENVSGYCGYTHPEDASWVFADGVLTISGEGYMADYNSDAEVPWRYLSENIHTVVVEEGILGVGDYAFSNCSALATVYLPSTLIVIEDYAFDGCPALADANINMSQQEFSTNVTWDKTKNTGLRDAEKHFTFIAEGQAGPNLTWKLTNDGILSFSGSGAMFNWTSSEPAPWYPYRSSVTQVRLAKVTTVGDYAFRGCTKLSSASFPSDLTYLGVRAFAGCSSLAAVYWAAPSYTNLTEIPAACFSGCTALQSFTVPKKCTVIGQGAFSGCDALTTVSFPEGSALTTVGKRAFYSCDNLKNISLPEGVTSLGDEAFYNCKSLTSFPLPSTLTSLGEYCFSGCSAVTGVVTIPAGVAEIPNRCFLGCSGFYELALSPGTNQIGPYAFYGCSKLTQVDYDGFRVQWEQETTLDSSGNAALINAHFSWLFRTGTLSGDGVHWSLYGGPGKLEIWGSGATPNWPGTPEAAPWYAYRDYIQIIDVHAGVTKIGTYAFSNCASLTTVYLPDSLTLVGGAAFLNDLELADVWYSGSLVERQAKLSIDTPNYPLESAQWHYTEIGGSVYGDDGGTDLSWLLDEDGTLRIYWDEDSMDQGEMAIPDYNDYRDTPWYQYGTGNGLIFPMITSIQVDELVTGIGDYAFAGLDELTDVQIASSVTSIGEGAFMGCGSLVSVTIPDTVETLGDNIFWGCGNLETATLPAGITEIPSGTFYGCEELTTVYLPGTLESIGTNAFSGCTSLTDIYFNGTSAQWAAIELNPGNDPVNSATIHFMPPEIAVDAVNFPDPAFRAYVAQYIDRDGSGYLDDYELQEANVIYASNLGIQSLQGIAFFYNLTHLDVSGNPLGGSLDLTTNPLLQNVNVSNCELNGLELTGLTHLNTLLLSDNDTGMSAPDLSTNLALEILDCHNCDGMEGLDLSANVNLTDLDCSWNQLESLDLSANTELQQLNCSHNSLTTLDLSANTELRQVFCNNNVLTDLELGQRHYSFITLSCYGNDLSFLDLTGCPRLRDAVLEGTVSVTDQYVEHRIGADYVQSDPDTVLKAASEGIPVDAEHFPDPAFRAYVANELDPNGDLWLTPQELAAVEDIDCSDRGIEDLTGVAWFSRLQTLDCSANNLTALSFSGTPLLKELDCSLNEELSALDPSSLSRLEVLNCYGCPQLTQLNVSANMSLHELDCRECALTGLTLGLQEDLWYLDCSDNALTVLDLSGCSAALQNLMCNGNALTALDLSACPGLRTLDCWDNELTGLDLSQNQFLIMADCHDNALTVLFLGHQPYMKRLYCQHNSLTSLDVMDCPYLLDLVQTTEPIGYEDYVYYLKDDCEFDLDPDVTLIQDHEGIPIDAEHFPDPAFRAYVAAELDLSHNGWLTEDEIAEATDIVCDGLGIVSLQGIHYFTALSYLDCSNNQIAAMDLSQNPALSYLDCSGNPLTALNVSGNAALSYLTCSSCALTSLDLSQNWALTSVFCDYNAELTELLLPPVETLSWLYCNNCALTSLDLSRCTGLTTVHCDNNALTELILGEQLLLNHLYCQHNSLARLDIFNCPLLMELATNGTVSTADGVTTYTGNVVLCVDEITVLVEDHDGIPVDEEHFPDPAFRAYVADHCDTSGNGWLNEAEINAVSSINVSNKGVETLQGIQYFTLLEELVCYNNSLTELDLEGLNLLHYLDASRNPFTTLDLSAYGSLGMVELQGTPSLTSLNVSGLSQLGYLDVSACGLTALDVSSCRSLYFLDCCSCPALDSLTLGWNEELNCFYAYNTENLSELDFTGCPALAAAWLDGPDKVENGVAWYYGTQELPCEMALDPDQAVLATKTITVTVRSAAESPDGESVVEIPGSGQYQSGQTLTLSAPAVAGYSFQGWYCGGELYSQAEEISYAVTLYSPDEVELVALYASNPYIPGDINGDCNVDGTDVVLLATYVKASGSGVTIVPGSGDVNGDGRV